MLMPKKSFRVFHRHAAAHFYIFFTDSMNSTDFHINYIFIFPYASPPLKWKNPK